MDDNIVPDNTDDLKNERAAVAMLLAAAASQVAEAPAPEPVGDINTLNDLFEQQKVLQTQRVELTRQLQRVREQSVELERQSADLDQRLAEVRGRAAAISEALFGGRAERPTPQASAKSEPQLPTPAASQIAKPRPLDNSVVIDRSVGVAVPGTGAPAEARAVTHIPSLII